MKKLLIIFGLLPWLSFGQTESACAPSDLATEVMDALRKVGVEDYEAYKSIFISGDELNTLINQLQLSEADKEMIRKDKNNETLNEQISNEFKDLVVEGESLEIDWKNIEYEDFFYRIRLRNGVKQLKGDIYFKEGEYHYEMRLQAAYINDGFHVLELDRLDISFELHGIPDGYEDHLEENYETEAIPAIEELEDLPQTEVEPPVIIEEEIPAPEAPMVETPVTHDKGITELNKNIVYHHLNQLFLLLNLGEYETAKNYLVLPAGMTDKQAVEAMKRIQANEELTRAGVARIKEEAIFGTVEELHGEWGVNKCLRAELDKDECYALKIDGSNIECMLHWDGGDSIRFFRVDNIR